MKKSISNGSKQSSGRENGPLLKRLVSPLLPRHENGHSAHPFSYRMLQAASLYMKNFPEKREPFFWNILTYELGAIDATIPDKDRAILRPLAYRFLSRAIEKTESGNQGVSFRLCPLQVI